MRTGISGEKRLQHFQNRQEFVAIEMMPNHLPIGVIQPIPDAIGDSHIECERFDGVLADSLDIYAEAVARSLERIGMPILKNKEDYLALFDGNFYESLAARGLIPIETGVLSDVLPASLFSPSPGQFTTPCTAGMKAITLSGSPPNWRR